MITIQDIKIDATFTIGNSGDGDEFKVTKIENDPRFGTLVTSVLVGKHTNPNDGYIYRDEINYFVNFLNDFQS